jgi:membrane-associated protease RseP (regulator of RpoE activity)
MLVLPPELEQPLNLVKQHFLVLDYYVRQEGGLEAAVTQPPNLKDSFYQLSQKLKAHGWVAFIRKEAEGRLILYVAKMPPIKTYPTRIAIILLTVTLGLTLIDGWARWGAPRTPTGYADTIYYAAGLLGILLIHEAGHKLAANLHKTRTSPPYFIPGIPVLALPTFGAFISMKDPVINRDSLFDIAIAGPIAGLVATILFNVPGVLTSQLAPIETIPPGAPILRVSILQYLMFLQAGMVREGYVIVIGPLAFASYLGFIITFLNLLPAWQLDGGHMARAVLGPRLHRTLTFATILFAIAIGFYALAIFLLFFALQRIEVRPLDDVSTISNSRRILWVAVIILAVLTAPLL